MRSEKAYLEDIVFSITKIEEFLSEAPDFEQFCEDTKTTDAIERRLLIIGEAVNQLCPDTTAQYLHIPFRKIVGLRNFLAHGYFGTSTKIIWDICHHDLPPLKTCVQELLGK